MAGHGSAHGNAQSAPPGAGVRSVTPRRRLHYETGGHAGGTSVSPMAKRPSAYVPPQPIIAQQMMDQQTLSNEVLSMKAAINRMHTWITSIAEASVDHATQIENASQEFQAVKSMIFETHRKAVTAHQTAEGQIETVLMRIDQILGDLKADDLQIKTVIGKKIRTIEQGLATVTSSIFPGLQH